MAKREDFPFIHRLRVRWQEVDAQQVVFNGHYLTYLDVAISEYWRAVGLPYPDGFTHHGGDMYARQHTLAYHAPAVLDDWLDVGVRAEHIGNSSMKIGWAVWSDHRLLVTGEAIYVHTSLATRRPEPVPTSVRDQIQAQAEGRPVTQLRLGRWSEVGEQAGAVRKIVFIGEQNIPEHEEWDADDAHALHAVVLNAAGLPLATGRLITIGQPAGQARIGRMAVLRSMRGAGVGREVLQALIDAARAQDTRTVTLHAQTSARRFYESQGFKADGDVFDEVGIPHIAMRLDFQR
ncbi:MAG TPA: GNAT family N-acetyltransferase [Candidatus Aquabacterium excrementipullorum]|nr:GNAT family N-acetyltransferase [Candidatus Aquabacterium excrementipullorum]